VLHLSGIQEYQFPRQADLPDSSYPDVTSNQEIYTRHILGEVRKIDNPLISAPIAAWNYRKNGVWDIKGQPGIPKPGEWAVYKGERVHDAYLANNVYGHVTAELGLSPEESLQIADTYSRMYRGKPDQPEDQAAIASGWYEYHTGNPWPPSMPKPTDF
jgi:hypothetical protein